MSSMTLEQVRDWHRQVAAVNAKNPKNLDVMRKHGDMADAIDAHIAGMGEPAAWTYESEHSSGSYAPNYFEWRITTNKVDTVGARRVVPLYTAPPIDLAAVREVIQTNWCDPLLSGPNAVLGEPPYGCPDIERLLRAISDKLEAAIKGVA